ncbi:hypothetical protein Pint_00232 [Pistacia integerrima]|uniref:Uncharacterized protein n=1 Tax=Pistacia integerrima TaxID=434235 RepID=A0ACC0ZQ87_9ROSI|nr:hypothetical protein Pint_00232 [Pistacia integerrima]
MWSCVNNNIFSSIRILRFRRLHIFPAPITAFPLLSTSRALTFMDSTNHSSSFASFAHSSRSGGRVGGRGKGLENDRERSRGRRGGGSGGKDKIDALGRLMTRILRHMASELNLNMQSDGYVKVQDLLKLNMKTFAQIPLSSHTVDDIREVGSERLLRLM